MSLEAETGILGAILRTPTILPRLTIDDQLVPDDFGHPTHRALFAAMLNLYARTGSVDAVALDGEAGVDADWLADTESFASPIGMIREHARIIKAAALRRVWAEAAALLYEAADTGNEEFVAQAEARLAIPTITDDTFDPTRLADEVTTYLDDDSPVGISTGFPALDARIGGGMRPGDLTVLGAWTGIGKSVLVDQVLASARDAGYSAHAYINEMSPRDRALRMIARTTTIPYGDLATRSLTAAQVQEAKGAAGRLPFGISEVSQWSADQIARHVRANRWDVCALDILHNMAYEKVSDLDRIVSTLAAAARSSGAHLIVVVHFNEGRSVGEVPPRPTARDIRGTGMIKNIAASVLLIHRQGRMDEDGFLSVDREGYVIVEKARHGRVGGIDVTFDSANMRFAAGHLRVAS